MAHMPADGRSCGGPWSFPVSSHLATFSVNSQPGAQQRIAHHLSTLITPSYTIRCSHDCFMTLKARPRVITPPSWVPLALLVAVCSLAAPTPVCQIQLTAALDRPAGAPDDASTLVSFVLTNLKGTSLQGWQLQFALVNASLVAATGASPVSPPSKDTLGASSLPIRYGPIPCEKQPTATTLHSIKNAAATKTIPPNGSAFFNALLRKPPDSASLLLRGVAVDDLACYSLPDGLSLLTVASSQAVQALPTSASCPSPQTPSPPCRLDWCCVAPVDQMGGQIGVSSPPKGTPATAPAAVVMPSAAAPSPVPTTSGGTPVAIPTAAAASVVAAALIVALALRCSSKTFRQRHPRAPRPEDVVIPPPWCLAPIVTQLLSTRYVVVFALLPCFPTPCTPAPHPLLHRPVAAPRRARPCLLRSPTAQLHRHLPHPAAAPLRCVGHPGPCPAAHSRLRLQTLTLRQTCCWSSAWAVGGLALSSKVRRDITHPLHITYMPATRVMNISIDMYGYFCIGTCFPQVYGRVRLLRSRCFTPPYPHRHSLRPPLRSTRALPRRSAC